jgi:hypothetical protein
VNGGRSNRLEALFAGLGRSVSHGHRSFPARADYLRAYAGSGGSASDPCADPDFVAAAARHWHTTGQTGCLFARRLAAISEERRWPTVVFASASSAVLARQLSESLESELAAALAAPSCEILSLLFPRIETLAELRELCELLRAHSPIEVSEQQTPEGFTIIAMRLALAPDGPLSWIMAFGPFAAWPPTRRGPFLELAIRVKPKPDHLFYKLNQDHSAAHLADSDPGLSEDQFSKLFERTEKATRDVLGTAPDERSAAKATFSFPTKQWLAASAQHGER